MHTFITIVTVAFGAAFMAGFAYLFVKLALFND